MTTTLAFDIYGTLIDTHGVTVELQNLVGDRAAEFSQRWRDKQLEYTFRRGLMDSYVDFSICTRQSLEYVAAQFGVDLSEQDKGNLMQCYASLPIFDDVADALSGLQVNGIPMYAFSNGTTDGVTGLLQHAGIRDYFTAIVSVDEIKTYKPNPAVYQHFLSRTNGTAASSWLISSNPFDVIGATAIGMQTAWIKRSATAIFDPWGIKPTATINSLNELPAVLQTN